MILRENVNNVFRQWIGVKYDKKQRDGKRRRKLVPYEQLFTKAQMTTPSKIPYVECHKASCKVPIRRNQ